MGYSLTLHAHALVYWTGDIIIIIIITVFVANLLLLLMPVILTSY